jgi:hypothetical protein
MLLEYFASLDDSAGSGSGKFLTRNCMHTTEKEKPGAQGPLVYLNCNGRLEAAVAEVEKNGGKILKPAHSIAPHGNRAVILDSEGNRVALHSR